MKFHPTAQILTWSILVIALQMLTVKTLFMVAGTVLLWALLVSADKLKQLVRRTRWIMMSLVLIYAFSTPGQPLLKMLGDWGPSWEGVTGGAVQLLHLLAVISGLAILLDRLGRDQLIAGLYTMFAPLQWIGLSRERFAVRVALTLHYAEASMLHEAPVWKDSLRSMFETNHKNDYSIELALHRFGFKDGLLMGAALMLLSVIA